MGSYITLGLGNLEVDWAKNYLGRNHSALFQADDYKTAPYFYVDNIVEERKAFVRPLRSVLKRIELLGFTLPECERLYNEMAATLPAHCERPFLTFAEFADVMKGVAAKQFQLPKREEEEDFDEFSLRDVFKHPEFIKGDARLADLGYDERDFFQNLEPYLLLRLLAENPANLSQDVVWRTDEVVEGGWVSEDQLYEGIPPESVCLVVTEGSSDGSILRHALPRVAPDIVDFFDFVDMTENYPFTGTGNLYRFCQGLARIRIQNRILVVLDNDTAGREIEQRVLSELDLPASMRVTVLPALEECRRMKTLGPTGEHWEDINGRAVAIECFLDFASAGCVEPTIRWTSYNSKMETYQGELLQKESYTRAFLDAVKHDSKYNYTKLAQLWDYLVKICTSPQNFSRQ